MNRDFGVNQGLVEELFLQWCANPSSVPDEWRAYFDDLPPEEQPELIVGEDTGHRNNDLFGISSVSLPHGF